MQKGSEHPASHAAPCIRIENLGVKFELCRNSRLKDILLGKRKNKDFFAIRNLSMTAESGDVIALFGKNGSGKTTLLRSIAGIYSCDEGKISTRGKISLLNINSGFNGDLDGRSNVYLAMSLYGMDKKTTDQKIGDILSFADIGKFINEPVRTYSTGMTARLGFAIGINVDADIILIDETFAVGDSEFKKKCLKKIEEIIHRKDKIIIVAGHDENIISKYCNKIIRLDQNVTDNLTGNQSNEHNDRKR